ncbi:MAG: hypothetical protein WD278_10770, partial [Pirellulales bacterium]
YGARVARTAHPVCLLRKRTAHPVCLILWASALLVLVVLASPAAAQAPEVHYQHQALAPPGAIGSVRLQRGGPLPGYFQPVEIQAPAGVKVSLALEGTFSEPYATPLNVGLLIAPVYRLRVSNIPFNEGQEVFPTIEVIDRLYTPAGQERRFPIPVELNPDDLRLAMEGKFVTRVIYLEDPELALPVREGPAGRPWYDAGPGANPLLEADQWGRPLAILRMGGRLPVDSELPDMQFLGGCPPFTLFRPWIESEDRPAEPGEEQPLEFFREGLTPGGARLTLTRGRATR